jgi:mannose-6-phosphate isomerase
MVPNLRREQRRLILTYQRTIHGSRLFRYSRNNGTEEVFFSMSMFVEDRVSRLFGKIRNYAWGGYNFIPTLIGLRPEPGMTYAEYWMGAHETAPSQILQNDGTTVVLSDLIKAQPERTLGRDVAGKYDRLPYLVKVMDVREMLSIQVHPTKSQAEAGFARENEMGIPLDSPKRNYKDDNSKLELEIALSDFWLLYGFRPKDQLQEVLNQIPEFHRLRPIFSSSRYFELYKYVMEMPQVSVNALLDTLVKRILQKYHSRELEESSPDYWVARALQGKQARDYDRGIFSIYFFNLLKLKPGQATFQDAGIPHAYLQGQSIEIMSNSDNVIRGGLTSKHVDVPQLLRLITFKGIVPEIIEGRQSGNPYETFYESPNHEFCLSRIQLNKNDLYENTAYSIEILLLLCGETRLDSADKQILMKKGQSIIIFAGKNYRISAMSENALLFRASIPNSHFSYSAGIS